MEILDEVIILPYDQIMVVIEKAIENNLISNKNYQKQMINQSIKEAINQFFL